jgi:signal transduction histidine kinase
LPSRIRLLRTESFQIAAGFAALFLGLTGLLLLVVYWIVGDAQNAALVAAVDADIRTVINGYAEEGVPEAVEVVRQRLGPVALRRSAPDVYIWLSGADGTRLAGNLPQLDPVPGLRRLPQNSILGRGQFLAPGVYLFVGRDTRQFAAVQTRIESAFVWIGVAALLMAGAAGVAFSLRLMRRIDAITATCQAINAGRFTDRVALRGNDDELDRLAAVINGMLDRIGGLMDNLRQVSSDVAHDLRTPLTHLRNRLDEARLRATSVEEYADAVGRAIDATDQLLSLFAALLRISQIESGSRRAAFRELSLSELLDHTVQLYAPVAEDRGSCLKGDVQPGVQVRGDAELLTQLFSNLIENAIRHTPSGTRVVIGLQSVEGAARASICDDGPGIPADERGKALRRFHRLAGSRSTPGHGLGLALVAAIAELHAATLQLADNQPGLCVHLSFAAAGRDPGARHHGIDGPGFSAGRRPAP